MAKKLLEESVISRFQKLANINGGKNSLLTEATKLAGGHGDSDGADRTGGPLSRDRKVTEAGDLEKELEEAYMDEAEEDSGEADMGGLDLGDAGDEMGADSEGGDLESAAEELISSLNNFFQAAGLDKEVESDQEEAEEESPAGEDEADAADMGSEKPPMMEGRHETEELEESIELVDDSLIEKLVARVSDRLVAEARKAKALAEGKKGSTKASAKGWEAHKPKHVKPPAKGKGSATKSGAGKPFGSKK